ncbi:MAG: hypothetical protein JSR90_06380 [Proteobacteria bacterium]|nr:hypothetical protein [Pseudomonadota bacterium]
MFSFATDLVSRAAQFLAATGREPGCVDDGLWTVTARGRIVGVLACRGGDWRLSWAADADPSLVRYAGTLDGDIEGLAEALSLRLGAPVRFGPLLA